MLIDTGERTIPELQCSELTLCVTLASGMPALGPPLPEAIVFVQFVHLSIHPSITGNGKRGGNGYIRYRRSYRGVTDNGAMVKHTNYTRARLKGGIIRNFVRSSSLQTN